MRPRVLRLVDETYLRELQDAPLETEETYINVCSRCETEFETTDESYDWCPNCIEEKR